MSLSYEVTPIGFVQSPFKEKFGIPRQPQICEVQSRIYLTGEANKQECIRGIELHSHIWVLFQFHQNADKGWQPLVRPPRLDGNKKLGVFATRSTFRPNQIGMSAVKLLNSGKTGTQYWLDVTGLDLLDGTPVLDIKPYIPYADRIPEATSELAPSAEPSALCIHFSDTVEHQISELTQRYPNLALTIRQILQQDPRPAYKKAKSDDKIYGMRLYDLNIRWQITDNQCDVIEVETV